MPDWLIWMAAIWFVASLSGRGSCGRGRGGRWRDAARLERERWKGAIAGPRMGGVAWSRTARMARPSQRSMPTPPPETAEARLQRQFVEGRLSLDEYEAELWKELRPR